MHHKNIKRIIIKQLKKQYPNWKRFNQKIKKEIAKKVLQEVTADYDFNCEVTASHTDLLGVEEQVPAKGIITFSEMANFTENINQNSII